MNLLLFGLSLTALVYRAYIGRQLTPAGVAAAVATACVHGFHSWNLPFVLLITFYLLGTAATRAKHDVKSRLTVSSSGSGGGEGARTVAQVLANSLVASVLTALHVLRMRSRGRDTCYDGDVLLIGIIGSAPPSPFFNSMQADARTEITLPSRQIRCRASWASCRAAARG